MRQRLSWSLLAVLDEGVALLLDTLEAPIAHDGDGRMTPSSKSPHDYSGVLTDVERQIREAIKLLPRQIRDAARYRVRGQRLGALPTRRVEIYSVLLRHLEAGGDSGARACRVAVREAGVFARNGLIDDIRRSLVPHGHVKEAS